jgi:shikimate kinase
MSGSSIVLIGFMGAGKTEVGKALAEASGLELVDTDADIEAAAGRSIADLFADEGEPAMRDREHLAVMRAVEQPGRVIACGGGAILALRNYEALRRAGDIVYLRSSPAALRSRLSDVSGRPLLRDPSAFDRLLAERTPAYEAAADHVIDTDGRTPAEIAGEILARVGSRA